MITTTLGVLVNAEPAMARLAALPLPAKTAYQVARLTRLIAPEIKQWHEHRNALVQELGAEGPATALERAAGSAETVFRVRPEHLGDFLRRVQDLADAPVELSAHPVSLPETALVSAVDLFLLSPFLAEPVDA